MRRTDAPLTLEEDPAEAIAGRVLGPAGALTAGIVFAVSLVLVETGWPPLRRFDATAIDSLNNAVSGRPWAVSTLHTITDLGGSEASWFLLTLTTLWLLIRRLERLAAYVAITGLGAGALSNGVKALVDRTRPTVEEVVATAPDPSFPSGHSLGSAVTYGVLLLAFLPAVPSKHRGRVAVAAIALVIAIGITRVALGVHFPSDVLGGWALGILWLGVTTAAFRRWRARHHQQRPDAREGLERESRPELVPARDDTAVFPHGWTSAAQLVVGGVTIAALLTAIGWLITGIGGGAVRPLGTAVIEWFVAVRTRGLSSAAVAIGWLGSTVGIVTALVAATSLTLAATRRWTPAAFLVAAVAGETAIFLAVVNLVERTRPPVEHLSPLLPPTSSFPSGHVAAATALYVGVALVVRTWGQGWTRPVVTWLGVAIPLGVALSRLYRGVHFPTDVLASLLLATMWLAVCWRVLQPVPERRTDHGTPGDRTSARGEPT